MLRANKSGREFGKLFEALGVDGAETPEEMRAPIEERKDEQPGGRSQARRVQ